MMDCESNVAYDSWARVVDWFIDRHLDYIDNKIAEYEQQLDENDELENNLLTGNMNSTRLTENYIS